MSLLVTGWPLVIAATGLLLHGRRQRRHRRELVLRACHELRGSLTNALLALDRPRPAARAASATSGRCCRSCGRSWRGPAVRSRS